MTKVKLTKYIRHKPKDRGGRENKKPYVAGFTHNGQRYNIGSFETLKIAQVTTDRKRIELGLEPVILKPVKNENKPE